MTNPNRALDPSRSDNLTPAHDACPPPASAAFYNIESSVYALRGLQPTSRVIDVTPGQMHIRGVEVGAGDPVLFLHGFSLTTAHWAPLMSGLPEYRCVGIDQPGHAGSSGVDFTGTDLRRWYRDTLVAVLDKMAIDRVHVVGHSQGAMAGLFLALDEPERVRSLVVIGTPAVAFGARLNQMRLLARRRVGRILLGMPKPRRGYLKILADTIGAPAVAALPPELIQANYLAVQRRGFGLTVSTYLREMFAGIDAEPARYALPDSELARIAVPVLVLWGEHDGDNNNLTQARTRTELIPGAHFEIVPGGHEPWIDDLDSCSSAIGQFLALRD
jgi:pimeloyl-ACP methyl ester carboxylesterase